MSFRCTACSDKSYDKAWKLQRHIRESSKCFEQLNPGISLTRFRCSSCDYTSPREEDLRRHHRRIHADIPSATCTKDAGQPMLQSDECSDVASCIQPATLYDAGEHSDGTKRLDPHPTSESPTAVIKRKTSGLDHLSPEHKRVCIEPILPDLDALSLVDESDARETSTLKTTENKDGLSLATWQPTAGGITALLASTGSVKLQRTSQSSIGAPKSISICGSSIGSLFGRPSTHAYEPWRTWSFISPHADSVRSLDSVGMPAPMLENVDEELLLSRAGNDLDKPRYWDHRATEVFVERLTTWSSEPPPTVREKPMQLISVTSLHISDGRRDSASSPHNGMEGPSFASLGFQGFRSKILDWSTEASNPRPGFAVQAYSYHGGIPTTTLNLLPAVQSSMPLTMESLLGINSSFMGPVPSLSTDLLLQSSTASDATRERSPDHRLFQPT
jgi:hypothetical protein